MENFRPIAWQPGNEDLRPTLLEQGLTDKQADAYILRLDGNSLSQIAEQLGITLGSVQDRLKYANAKLRHHRAAN